MRRLTAIATLLLGAGTTGLAQNPAPELVAPEPVRDCVAELPRRTPLDSALATCIPRLRVAGYLEANLDRIARDTAGRPVAYHVHLGPRYDAAAWRSGVDPDARYGPVRADTLARPTDLADLPRAADDYLERLGREGYPFARVRYDSLRADAAAPRLAGRATTWSGPRVTYGGVRFVDEAAGAPVSARYLERTLRVEPGRLFRAADVAQVERRLRGIPFLAAGRPPVVVFESGQAFLYLDAKPRKTSRFDFLLGFLPNSPNNEGQLLLTGDLTLELENALRRGERLFVSFERLQPESTEAELALDYPYLLDSPFGARARFTLYRQQDDWLRIAYEAGGSLALGGGDAVELYYEGGQAQVLGFDTARVVATQRLPEVLDAARNGFGARLRLDRRDDPFATRRGWRLLVGGAAALRTVEVPTGILDLAEGLGRQADSLGGRTGQYRAELTAERYLATGRRATVALQLRGASLFGRQTPLRNELYRIGGNRLLRGFDEQSLDAQHYAVATAEYRLLIGGGSYLFAFADQGALVDPYRAGGRREDAPTGFGAGLRLATRGGALQLTYAYGRRSGAPVEWDRAKVHIGFASRF